MALSRVKGGHNCAALINSVRPKSVGEPQTGTHATPQSGSGRPFSSGTAATEENFTSPLLLQGQVLDEARRLGSAKFALERLNFDLYLADASSDTAQLSCRGFWKELTENNATRVIMTANAVSQVIPFVKIAIDEARGEVMASSHAREISSPLQFLRTCQSIIDAINLFLFEVRDLGPSTGKEKVINWNQPWPRPFRDEFQPESRQFSPHVFLSALRRTGHHPTITDGLDIAFDDAGLEYTITLDEGDPSHFQMDCLDFARLPSQQRLALGYRAANKVNQPRSGAKILVCAQRRSASATFQSACPEKEADIDSLINQALIETRSAVASFRSNLQDIDGFDKTQSTIE